MTNSKQKNLKKNSQVEFKVEYEDTEVRNIKTHVKGPKSSPAVGTQKTSNGQLKCHFVPGETGRFEVNIFNYLINKFS